MGQTIYLTGSEPLVQAIARAAYPSYQGRKFKLRTTDGPINVRSYWDGGSRDYYVFVRLSDMHATGEVPAQSAYDRRIVGADAVPLPAGVVCVQHSIFCGKDMGLTIIAGTDTLAPLLPAAVELTREVAIVLAATRGLKSSYGGVPNFRFVEARKETGITSDQWTAAKQTCIELGYLTTAGAITVSGRNAIGRTELSQYRRPDRWAV